MQTPHVVAQKMATPSPKLFKWLVEGLRVCGAPCRGNSCDSWPSESNGKEKRNKRTFTKAPANVKSLLTPLACSSQVLTIEKKKKVITIQASHFNISTVVCGLAANCLLTVVQCPERTPASPWPRVSTFCRPRWTQQETASRAKTAVRGTREASTWMNTLFSSDTVYSCEISFILKL